MPSCDWGDRNCNCRECREDRQHIKDFSIICEYWERHKIKFLKVISDLNSTTLDITPDITPRKEYNSHRLYKILQKYQYD
jgi:hypothetical protein